MGKRKTKNRKFSKENCAPKTRKNRNKYTCYTSESLKQLREMWNARHPDVRIKNKQPRKIWDKMKKNLRTMCNSESCWIRQNFAKKGYKKLIGNFAPMAPSEWQKDPYTWLSSIDIGNVMKQYEKIEPCFVFIGPSPIDYDTHEYDNKCVWEELCKFNLKKHYNNFIRKIGIIFNLDPHTKGGSHWVCSYIDLAKREIYYFDSYGEPIPRQIMKFVKMVQTQSKQLFKKEYKFISNDCRHQYSTTECGMYCLYVIIYLLKGGSFKRIISKKIPDKAMYKLRKKWFNHKKHLSQ